MNGDSSLSVGDMEVLLDDPASVDAAPWLGMIEANPDRILQRDGHGATLLHYLLQDPYVFNEGLHTLVNRIVELRPAVARQRDNSGELPLQSFVIGMHEQDYDGVRCWADSLVEHLDWGQADVGRQILVAFPEAMFETGLFHVLTDHEWDNMSEDEEDEDEEQQQDDEQDDHSTAVYKFMLSAFPHGLQEIPPPNSGRRIPLHVVLSFASMKHVDRILDWFWTEQAVQTRDSVGIMDQTVRVGTTTTATAAEPNNNNNNNNHNDSDNAPTALH